MKTLIVDDHLLVREGLQAILRRAFPDMSFLDASDGASMQAQLQAHPDTGLVLLDVQLQSTNGLDLLPGLAREFPSTRVVMLSGDYDRDIVTRAIEQGAAGFLPKTSLDQVLVSAIQLVLVGGVYIPPEILQRPAAARAPAPAGDGQGVFAGLGAPPQIPAPARGLPLALTGRQIEVFRYLLEGLSNKQICRQLDLAEATVKIHVRAILRSLHVNSRTEAVVAAAKLGIRSDSIAEDLEGQAR